MLLNLASIALGLLAAAVLFVSRRSRRHLGLALWIAASLLAGIVHAHATRALLPFAEALDLATSLGFVLALAHLVAAPRWLTRAGLFVAALALGVLVVGPAFPTEPFALATRVAFDALLAAYIVPSFRTTLDDLDDTDEHSAFVAGLVLGAGMLISAILATIGPRLGGAATIVQIAATLAALGAYAPRVFDHAFRGATPELRDRIRLSQRRYAMFEMSERVNRSRLAHASLATGATPRLADFPNAGALAQRAGLETELLRIAAIDMQRATAIDLLVAVASSVGRERQAGLLADVEALLTSLEPQIERDEPIGLLTVLQCEFVRRYDRLMTPLLVSATAMVQGMALASAKEAVAMARKIVPATE